MQKLKDLVIPGIAGILLACAIFSAFVMAPWSETITIYYPLPSGTSPITVNLTISEFTNPLGPGSEAELTATVTSEVDASNVVVQIDLSKAYPKWPSKGVDWISGNLTWNGNLTAGVPITLNARINATEIGYGKIVASAKWYGSSPSSYLGASDLLGIVVLDDEIWVFEDLHGDLPYWPSPDFQPPIWPSPEINSTIPYPPSE